MNTLWEIHIMRQLELKLAAYPENIKHLQIFQAIAYTD